MTRTRALKSGRVVTSGTFAVGSSGQSIGKRRAVGVSVALLPPASKAGHGPLLSAHIGAVCGTHTLYARRARTRLTCKLRVTNAGGGSRSRSGRTGIGAALFGEVQVRRVRIVSLAIVVVVTAWTVTACKSGGAQPSPSLSPTLSAPSPTASQAPGVAAIQ